MSTIYKKLIRYHQKQIKICDDILKSKSFAPHHKDFRRYKKQHESFLQYIEGKERLARISRKNNGESTGVPGAPA